MKKYDLRFMLLLVLSCILFVCNAEAIAMVNTSIFPFLKWMRSGAFLLALLSVALFWTLAYCVIGSLRVSYLLMMISTGALGMANRVLRFTRAQFVTVAEIDVLGEAAEVKVDMGVAYHPIVIVLAIIEILVYVSLWIMLKKRNENSPEQEKKNSFKVRVVGLLGVAAVFMIIYFRPSQLILEEIQLYRNMGNVFWFCQSVFGEMTKEISAEEVDEIYDEFVEMAPKDKEISEKRPNIIVIMSEAFWDINNLEGIVEASENPMDRYYELTKDALNGQVAVNIYGGGTNNSEFEFLTGINAKYIANKNCYNEYFDRAQESMVSYLNGLGYYSMAFHPYDADYWARETGYMNMGFEEFYSDVDFKNREMCHGYISDKSLTKEIIERFEDRKAINPEQPVFTFVVSVQNHVNDMGNFDDASAKKGCTGITTTVNGDIADDISRENVEEYYNGMRESIEALEELLTYYENYDEDTMVVFFGDHAPLFVNLICDTEGKESEMNLYRTPYMIWTNYENSYKQYGDFNLSYLSSVLIECLDFPKTRQYYVNKYMLENCKINTKYERIYSNGLDKQKVIDAMNTVLYMCENFPKEEMALHYWKIVNP